MQPDHPRVVELRELSRVEDDLGEELRRLSNRLREQLHRFFPQPLTLCPAADDPWFWALLDRAPTPAHAQRLSAKTVAAVLKVYRVGFYPVAKPTALMLDWWLGHEGVRLLGEDDFKALITHHMKAKGGEVGMLEGIGATNFLEPEESASPNYCRGALTRLPGLPTAIVEWMGSLDGTGGVSSPRLFVRG